MRLYYYVLDLIRLYSYYPIYLYPIVPNIYGYLMNTMNSYICTMYIGTMHYRL